MSVQYFIENNKGYRIIILVGVVSMLFIILIKGVIRPLHLYYSHVATVLQGILPDFFAASGFSAFSFIYLAYFLSEKKCKNAVRKAMIFSFAVSFLILLIWEYIQFFIWQYSVDLMDILASAVGSAVMVALIIFLTKRKKKKLK